jgi:predicted GH43/DUF377 family glycosyl hydrolase
LSKGVFIPAFQKRGYPFAAHNLAVTIKHFNPDIKVAIYHDHTINHLHAADKEIFDVLIPMMDSDKIYQGNFSPAHLKLSLYDKLPFDETLILDADNLAIADIGRIFDELSKEGGYYYTHVKELYQYDGEREIQGMDWAYADDIYNHFKLKRSVTLPCTNSSFQYVRKCKEAKELFEQALLNLENAIPLDKLKHNWGGGQPDELYINVAMAQKGITGKAENEYMHLCNVVDRRPMFEMAKTIPLLSYLGGKNFCRPTYTEYYDKLMIDICNKHGKSHRYRWTYIEADKYSGVNHRMSTKAKSELKIIKSGLIPITETKLIDKKKLISSYNLPNGNKFRVTNYFNCSFIEFQGRKYFAYRMEAQPFCIFMKIGLCLLDDNYEPIPETNVLLDLYSNIKGSDKGFHVEDPRLFIYNDELYLSYTDGYQMGQAKINPDNLKAIESFYLDKPDPSRTEKNWTFFEDKKKLIAIYDLPSMHLFEMDGAKYKEVNKSTPVTWKYGEIRGGATPIKVGNKFICFFHSRTTILQGKYAGYQYHMGALEFEAKKPYKITRISSRPIISGETMNDKIPRLSNKIFVVFPCGVIRTENGFNVSFGYNDYEPRYANVSDELLNDTLIEL